jgi:hypothetical protein
MQYEEAGYLSDAMVNYLARLGWSHGDEELFEREQLIAWFDGQHLARSPAQWDAAKLNWVNAHRLKLMDDAALAALVSAQLKQRGIDAPDEVLLSRLCSLYKDRCATTGELADWLRSGPCRSCGPCHSCGAPWLVDVVRASGQRRMDEERDRRGHQGNARRIRFEDAATGARSPCAGVRPDADAVARRGARVVLSRCCDRTLEPDVIFCL